MTEAGDRIAAFRAKLYAKKEDKKWSLSEFVKSVSGPIAIVISIATAYFTNFRAVDDVRVIVHSAPSMRIDKHGVTFDGNIKLSVFNAGNRLAVVTAAGLTIGTRKLGSTPATCADSQDQLTINYGVEITPVEAQKMVPFVLAGIEKDPQDNWADIPILHRKIMLCLRLHIATPDSADQSGDVVLASDLEGNADTVPTTTLFSGIGPTSLFRHTGTTLFK
jgi:hypothetical protein